MSKHKKKLFRIFAAIPKIKWIYFAIISLLLIFFTIQAIRYSDIPIWNNAPKYFTKPQNADMLLYNLSVGYMVSYMFYILVNFIPDFVEAVEKQNKIVPFKATIHRQVQQFTNGIIDLWMTIGVNAVYKGGFNKSEMGIINDFFKFNVIQKITKYVRLEQLIEDYIDIDVRCNHYIWSIKMRHELEDICTLGNLILTRYKNDIPLEIFYDIFYILNESQMVGELLSELKCIASLRNGKNFCLSDCINFEDDKGQTDIKQSCQSIINLYNWVNNQYDYLSSNNKDSHLKINKIDIEKFIK